MTQVQLKAVRKEFGSFVALEHIDLDIQSGELVALLGPSGCGKTTTLRMISGLDNPTSGEIFFDGKDVSDVPVRDRNVGMVFQRYALFPHMSVEKNITFGLRVRNIPVEEVGERLEEILDIVQLTAFRDRFPAQLSGGQMQRVAIARTLITKPSVLMMDEPLANLDTNLRGEMRRFIRELQQRFNITTIFVTHDQVEAMELSDRVAVLFDGRLEQFDTPDGIYHRPDKTSVAKFMGASNIIDGVVADGALNTAFAELSVGDGGAFSAGSQVKAMVRSEAIRLLKQPETDVQNQLSGTIRTADFFGATVSYVVQVGDFELNVDEHSTEKLEPGTPVYLQLPRDRIWLFPDGTS
ncbi:ABC transporter ATP-binding protein [Hoeflea sp. TYP-13]|uniref:ABC transporter ATP-binding protein n=1 Tax=Hoeflea sp. TYP-13 TaxID=3230023 RepID=UPI0034C64315